MQEVLCVRVCVSMERICPVLLLTTAESDQRKTEWPKIATQHTITIVGAIVAKIVWLGEWQTDELPYSLNRVQFYFHAVICVCHNSPGGYRWGIYLSN